MNLGPTNMMVVRFNSDQYSTVSPGAGFVLTATAKPSGMCTEIKSDWLIDWVIKMVWCFPENEIIWRYNTVKKALAQFI